MVHWQALYLGFQAVHYLVKNRIPGDFVECGVWRGGCSLLLAETLARLGETNRKIYLFDTFTGMSEPTVYDRKSSLGSASSLYQKKKKGGYVDWCYAPLEQVRQNIRQCPYPEELFVLVPGKVEDTIPQTLPASVALLRLDTDWYESTHHELVHLYPKLVPGGVFISDDYGTWEGARKAVQEYFAHHESAILLQYDYASDNISGVKVR